MFNKVLINLILDGKKTMTSRDKPQCRVGEITNMMANQDYSKLTGKYLKITKVYQKPLKEFTDSDANKEGFSNLSDFKRYWENSIGEWDNFVKVWVHEFEVIEKAKLTNNFQRYFIPLTPKPRHD